MLKIGLTGGIGSGKTTVCNVFNKLGIPVYHADIHAKIISDADPEVRKALTKLLGDDIYSGGHIDRVRLSEIIFHDSGMLKKVNAIIHPRVREHFFSWLEGHRQYPYVLQEAAILFESGAYRFFDRLIAVTAPLDLRISRVLSRQTMTREQVMMIIDNQLPEEERIKRAHFIVTNDDKTAVLPQVLEIHKKLLLIKEVNP